MRKIGIALSVFMLIVEALWAACLVWFIRVVNCPWAECAPRDLVYVWLELQIVLLPLTLLAVWYLQRQYLSAARDRIRSRAVK